MTSHAGALPTTAVPFDRRQLATIGPDGAVASAVGAIRPQRSASGVLKHFPSARRVTRCGRRRRRDRWHSVFMDGLRIGLIATVAVLGVTAALSLTLRTPQHSRTNER